MNIERLHIMAKTTLITLILVPALAFASLVDIDGNPVTNETYLADIDMAEATFGDVKDNVAAQYDVVSTHALNSLSKAEAEAGYMEWNVFCTDGNITTNTYDGQTVGIQPNMVDGLFMGWVPTLAGEVCGSPNGEVDSTYVEWTSTNATIAVGYKLYGTRHRITPTKMSHLTNDLEFVTADNLHEEAFEGYGWPFGEWTYTPPEAPVTLPVFTNNLWRYTWTNEEGVVVGSARWIESPDGENAVWLEDTLNGTNVVFTRDATEVYTNVHGFATVSNLQQYVKHTQMEKTLKEYVLNETLENYDASYGMVQGLTNLNQTIQFVINTSDTVQPLNIQMPENGRCKDWIVYVLATTNMTVHLPPATYWMKTDSVTNDVPGGVLTALYFTQVSADDVYVIGRQEYSTLVTIENPASVPLSIGLMNSIMSTSGAKKKKTSLRTAAPARKTSEK